MCPICKKGQSITRKLNKNTDHEEKQHLIGEYEIYQKHQKLAEYQRSQFNLQKENL